MPSRENPPCKHEAAETLRLVTTLATIKGNLPNTMEDWLMVPILAARDDSIPVASENLIDWHDAEVVEPVGQSA